MSNDIKAVNIGNKLSNKLIEAGINTIQELKETGSKNAFEKIRTIDSSACLDMLYALEGAVQNIRWHDLDRVKKNELKDFFINLK